MAEQLTLFLQHTARAQDGARHWRHGNAAFQHGNQLCSLKHTPNFVGLIFWGKGAHGMQISIIVYRKKNQFDCSMSVSCCGVKLGGD